MEIKQNNSLIDLSSARKFFADAVMLAHEYATLSDTNKNSIKEIENIEGEAMGWSLYESLPGVSFKKFYATKNTKLNKEVCKNYFKIIVVVEGCLIVETEQKTMSLPLDKKFCYLNDGQSFCIEFIEDTWFYVLSIPL